MFKILIILFLRALSVFLPVSLLGLVSRTVPTLTSPNGAAIALAIGIFVLAILLSLLINFLAYSFKESSVS